jgi:tetratricopeptide (TPR) repeat protein
MKAASFSAIALLACREPAPVAREAPAPPVALTAPAGLVASALALTSSGRAVDLSAAALDADALLAGLRELVKRGDFVAARTRADEALTRFPDRVEAHYAGAVVEAEVCRARHQAGALSQRRPEDLAHCEQCIVQMTAVIERGGYRHDHYNRGYCQAYLGFACARGESCTRRFSEAEADFSAGIVKHPDDGDYFGWRADMRELLGRKQEACADWRTAERLGAPVGNQIERACGNSKP